MTDLSTDPLINAVHNGIKRGIRVALENDCLGSAVILILSGIDAMAYVGMPAGQEDVTRNDFITWVERYIKFSCSEQLSGWDLYGARCAMLHSYGTASDLSRKGKCRQMATWITLFQKFVLIQAYLWIWFLFQYMHSRMPSFP